MTIFGGGHFDHCENAESSGMVWEWCFDVLQILSPSARSRRCYLDQRSKAQHPLGQDSPWRIPRKSQQSSIQTLLSSSKLYRPLCTYLVVSSYTNINHQGWTGHCSLQSYWQVLAEVAALLKWMARSPGFIGKILPPCGSLQVVTLPPMHILEFVEKTEWPLRKVWKRCQIGFGRIAGHSTLLRPTLRASMSFHQRRSMSF